ncbi:Spindle assembly abnormal protein 6 like protein [Astathelohania contejeani]|uniref:Spindle assembly abnormal protein 6 like protein n=1 Tax=Astathelohania contejeani TaxID=164912 RepID=A0ABQ7I0D2_9MICR|nr:Spindle assembly abnormal protein 6 like protein [Thelohania contejeani]
MRESVFTGRIPIHCQNNDIPTLLKCDVTKEDDKVEIRLIDTKDLFTFFVCAISSGDFYMIKREQDIRVDFERFTRKLIEMFHNLSRNKLTASFDNNKFKFIEKNEFRNIIRLELKFFKPDESHYRRYLSDVISRMEGDNIKLIKDNSLIKEQCRCIEKDLQDRIRFLESENNETQRKIEKLYRERDDLMKRVREKEEDNERCQNKIVKLEKEKNKLEYEIEKMKIHEVKIETLNSRIEDLLKRNEELETDINTANDIIKKLRVENKNMKKELEDVLIKQENFENKTNLLKRENDESTRKIKTLEEKNKKLKSDLKEKSSRLETLENENRLLAKKLDDAQSVYNHFYSKKVESVSNNSQSSDSNSIFSSIQPESPPHL